MPESATPLTGRVEVLRALNETTPPGSGCHRPMGYGIYTGRSHLSGWVRCFCMEFFETPPGKYDTYLEALQAAWATSGRMDARVIGVGAA